MSTPNPFISISNVQIYDKLCAVERDVSELKTAEAVRSAGERNQYRHKVLLYPTVATAAAGLVAGVVALLK
jgi:hypothetical protein